MTARVGGAVAGIGAGAWCATTRRGFRVTFALRSRREGDALARHVHIQHAHLEFIPGLHHLRRVAHEAFGQLGDVHESILVDANIDECPEGGYVGYHAL